MLIGPQVANLPHMRLILLLLGAIVLAGAPVGWTPELSIEFQNIGAVVPSPDGKLVAWVQTKSVVETERSEQISQIWLAGADGSRRIQLTRGEHSSTAPQFSPDGRYVYFLSSRAGKNAVYRIRIGGGEAEPLTVFKGAAAAFEVSPDGKRVVFTGYEPPADEEKAKKEKRDFRVIDANPENHALYLIPAEPDAYGKREQKKLVDKYHVAEMRWSPDSRSIAYGHWPAPLADNWTRADIAEVKWKPVRSRNSPPRVPRRASRSTHRTGGILLTFAPRTLPAGRATNGSFCSPGPVVRLGSFRPRATSNRR